MLYPLGWIIHIHYQCFAIYSFSIHTTLRVDPEPEKLLAIETKLNRFDMACWQSESELQALVDILSGSFDTNTSPALSLLSTQHHSAASHGRSNHEPSGFTEECHVAIVRARNLPAVQGGFFCIISCTGGRGGGRTGVFQGGDSGFFTQEATVRGGGDVVVWLYRNDGDATGIVGEVWQDHLQRTLVEKSLFRQHVIVITSS